MKQPFGIDFNVENVASVFATCISCFNSALGSTSHEDQALRLSLLRLRLTRWGEAVEIYGGQGGEQDYIQDEDIEEVNDILMDMLAVFQAASAQTKDEANNLTSRHPASFRQSVQESLSILEMIASDRFKGESLLGTEPLTFSNWSMSLVEDVLRFVIKLEQYIPAGPEQRDLCAAEVKRLTDAGIIMLLQRFVSEKSDPLMSNCIKYQNQTINGVNINNSGFIVNSGVVIAGNITGSNMFSDKSR